MTETIAYYVSLGFGLSMFLFFQGQAVRIFCEIIESSVKRKCE